MYTAGPHCRNGGTDETVPASSTHPSILIFWLLATSANSPSPLTPLDNSSPATHRTHPLTDALWLFRTSLIAAPHGRWWLRLVKCSRGSHRDLSGSPHALLPVL